MKKVISSVIAIALGIVCHCGIPLSASNNGDTGYYFSLPAENYYVTQTVGREKTDTTPSYVNFDSSNNSYLNTYGVQYSIHGGYTSTTVIENCTCNGSSCIIFPGTARRIHQTVYEDGYSYAFLGASAPNQYVAGKNVSGLWSPDSTGDSPFAN